MADNNGDTERKPLTHAGFDNPEVLNAVSPHPTFGYFHGPIPNLNLQGIPSENAATNAISYVDPTHSVICDVVVGENGEMCGKIYPRPSALRKHLSKKHPGSGVAMPPVLEEINPLQIHTVECALKKWVLPGGWRNAVYLNEPRRGYGLITEYCDALEWIAAINPRFAARFGRRFHHKSLDFRSELIEEIVILDELSGTYTWSSTWRRPSGGKTRATLMKSVSAKTKGPLMNRQYSITSRRKRTPKKSGATPSWAVQVVGRRVNLPYPSKSTSLDTELEEPFKQLQLSNDAEMNL